MHWSTLGKPGSLTILCYSRKSNNKNQKKALDSSKKEEVIPKTEQKKPIPAPPRIVDTSTRSLKSQIRIVKSWQANASASGEPTVQRKYRRKRAGEPEDVPEKELDELQVAAHERWLLMQGKGLTSLYQQKASRTNPAAVLVDGYNVMHKWMEHSGQRLLKIQLAGDLQAQREAFLMELSAYSGWNNLRMMVAFDAQCNPDAPPISRNEVGGLEVVFIGDVEADSFIVKEAQLLRSTGCPYVLVATSDNDIQDACWSNEIFPVSAAQLLQQVHKAKKAFERYQKERGIRDAGSRLGAALLQGNPDVYRELEKKRYPGT